MIGMLRYMILMNKLQNKEYGSGKFEITEGMKKILDGLVSFDYNNTFKNGFNIAEEKEDQS